MGTMIQVALSRATVVSALTHLWRSGRARRLALRMEAWPPWARVWTLEVTGREPHRNASRTARFALTVVAGGVGSQIEVLEETAGTDPGWQGAAERALWAALCRHLAATPAAPIRGRSLSRSWGRPAA